MTVKEAISKIKELLKNLSYRSAEIEEDYMHFDDWWQIEKHREKTQEEYETYFKLVRDEILLPEQAADRLHISLREFRERFEAVRGRE